MADAVEPDRQRIVTARPNYDQPATIRPRSGALHYAPLPADVLRQLARLAQLIRTAPNAEELEWLQEQAAAVMAECDDCPPVAVRNAGDPPARRRQRHEERYGRRGFGPRNNKSGRAKS